MNYGDLAVFVRDQATITAAHNLALRRVIAAIASVLEFDRACAESCLAEALAAIEQAERVGEASESSQTNAKEESHA